METITLSISQADADRLYAAVGRQLAKGDVQVAEGQSQFVAVLVAAFKGNGAQPEPTKPTPTPTLHPTAPGKR